MRRAANLLGKKFGMLTMLQLDPKIYPDKKARWLCRCDCGKEVTVSTKNLYLPKEHNCGCSRNKPRTHGKSYSREYGIWTGIKQRCTNPKDPDYARYGAVGITISDDWKNSFEAFYRDMGPRPSPAYSVDRRKNSEGYSKENCRWATRIEQANNTTRNIFYEIDGKFRTIAGWCRELNLEQRLIYNRVYILGWSFEDAIRKPPE